MSKSAVTNRCRTAFAGALIVIGPPLVAQEPARVTDSEALNSEVGPYENSAGAHMKRATVFALVISLLAAQTHGIAQGRGGRSGGLPTSPLSSLLALLRTETNPVQAVKDVSTIWDTDRWFTFPKFEETATNVADIMRRAGLEDVEIGRPLPMA